MSLKPCWEIKKCGREKEGVRDSSLGPCPAYPQNGHSCWLVTGTLCEGQIQGTFAQKEMNCLQCEVYRLYNLRSGTKRIELAGEYKSELGQCIYHGLEPLQGTTPEAVLETISDAIGATLEERIQERTRELVLANENLKREIEYRKKIEKQMRHMAFHDSLTDLPNRVMLEKRLAEEIDRVHRERQTLAVLLIDLDRFKTINDTLGHSTGDKLLKAVAKRLKEQVRKYDIVSRLSGDQFVVVLSKIQEPQHIARLAGRILARLRAPLHIEKRKLYITLTVGIAVYPGDGKDPQELLKNADCAMYRAKDLGRNGYQFYEPEMNKRVAEQAHLEMSLAEAVKRQEFILEYQPQLDLRTNTIVGMEALVRWLHPEQGLIPPGDFIPMAEETGLILPLGEWVLRAACKQNKAWQQAGYAPLRMAINLSARQFRQQILGKLIEEVIKETGLDPKWLEIEITESDIMLDTANTISQLRQLSEKGVRISLDDFGTGYSALNYLKWLPVDSIKIDRTFVRNLATEANDVAIANAIIVMAHTLKLNVVAEGVETAAQLDLLRRLECDAIQGFLFSRPLAPDKAVELLAKKDSMVWAGEADGDLICKDFAHL